MTAVVLVSVLLPGFWARLSVLLGLVFGFALSWVLDRSVGEVTGLVPATGQVAAHLRVDLGRVAAAPWVGLPARTMTGPHGREIAGWHLPSFSLAFVLLVLPAVIALIAENTGHVKAVGAMTGTDLDPYLGRAFLGDGWARRWPARWGVTPPPRTPRTSGAWPRPASTPPPPPTSPRAWRSCSASSRSSARWWRPLPAACSAGSPWSSTA